MGLLKKLSKKLKNKELPENVYYQDLLHYHSTMLRGLLESSTDTLNVLPTEKIQIKSDIYHACRRSRRYAHLRIYFITAYSSSCYNAVFIIPSF